MVEYAFDRSMAYARRPPDGQAAVESDEDRTLTAEVVLMELARAEGPISASALAERTLLSAEAVEAALSDLARADICTVRPGDERRPRRYAVEHSSPTRA